MTRRTRPTVEGAGDTRLLPVADDRGKCTTPRYRTGPVTGEGASKTRGYRSDQVVVTESVSPGCGIVPRCPGRSRAPGSFAQKAAQSIVASPSRWRCAPPWTDPGQQEVNLSHRVSKHPGQAPKRRRHHDPHRHRPRTADEQDPTTLDRMTTTRNAWDGPLCECPQCEDQRDADTTAAHTNARVAEAWDQAHAEHAARQASPHD